jgi:hypothetical protein
VTCGERGEFFSHHATHLGACFRSTGSKANEAQSYHALHFSREEAGIDQIAPEVEHAHITPTQEPGAAAPGSCYGRRIALCRAFSFGRRPERALASDKTLDDEKVPGASFIVNGAAPAEDEMNRASNRIAANSSGGRSPLPLQTDSLLALNGRTIDSDSRHTVFPLERTRSRRGLTS